MTRRLVVRAVPVEAPPPQLNGIPDPSQGPPDYADAFAVERSAGDARSAEQWARDGFASMPERARAWGMRAHRHLLGFVLGPADSAQHLFGWRVASACTDRLHLQATGVRMQGDMLWQLQHDQLVLTTFVHFHQPRRARPVWAWAGRVHRRSVPALLVRAARAGFEQGR